MHYRLVKVPHGELQAAGASVPQPLSVDGTAPAPGEYATTVMELPASQTLDGRPLVRGYYAVLWPMDEVEPRYDAGPLYFGPYPSPQVAREVVAQIVSAGTAVEPPDRLPSPGAIPASAPAEMLVVGLHAARAPARAEPRQARQGSLRMRQTF